MCVSSGICRWLHARFEQISFSLLICQRFEFPTETHQSFVISFMKHARDSKTNVPSIIYLFKQVQMISASWRVRRSLTSTHLMFLFFRQKTLVIGISDGVVSGRLRSGSNRHQSSRNVGPVLKYSLELFLWSLAILLCSKMIKSKKNGTNCKRSSSAMKVCLPRCSSFVFHAILFRIERKKRNESMKNERIQLTAKLTHLEQENSVREQQLQSEQTRIKELQMNIQMLNDHNSKYRLSLFCLMKKFARIDSIKRDAANEERKYDQEKSLLTQKFERTKQQWTDVFKPQCVVHLCIYARQAP